MTDTCSLANRRLEILGVHLHPLQRAEFLDTLLKWAEERTSQRVSYSNIQAMNLAATDERFKSILNASDLVFCDGYGVILGAKALGMAIPERHTVMDWIDDLLHQMDQKGLSLYLLGAEKDVVSSCAELISRRHQSLRVVGYHHGFLANNEAETARVCDEISGLKPNVLMVGMGMPRQELWVDDNRHRLDFGVAVTVGAAFRWYTGVERRAPRWIADHGFEWLWRLAHHPIRFFSRYAVGNPVFMLRVARAKLGQTLNEDPSGTRTV